MDFRNSHKYYHMSMRYSTMYATDERIVGIALEFFDSLRHVCFFFQHINWVKNVHMCYRATYVSPNHFCGTFVCILISAYVCILISAYVCTLTSACVCILISACVCILISAYVCILISACVCILISAYVYSWLLNTSNGQRQRKITRYITELLTILLNYWLYSWTTHYILRNYSLYYWFYRYITDLFNILLNYSLYPWTTHYIFMNYSLYHWSSHYITIYSLHSWSTHYILRNHSLYSCISNYITDFLTIFMSYSLYSWTTRYLNELIGSFQYAFRNVWPHLWSTVICSRHALLGAAWQTQVRTMCVRALVCMCNHVVLFIFISCVVESRVTSSDYSCVCVFVCLFVCCCVCNCLFVFALAHLCLCVCIWIHIRLFSRCAWWANFD
jgi:hypothetical protein